MKKIIKWVLIVGAAMIGIVLAALIVIPKLVNVEQYRPQIEKQVSQAIGRPFSLGKDFQLSLFPWAGVSFSELSVGSPEDFTEKTFLAVKSFEVRVKLVPLLFKDIQVKRFVLIGPRVVLETLGDGRVNWVFQTEAGKEAPVRPGDAKTPSSADKEIGGIPIKGLDVGEFTVSDGSVLWIDHRNKQRKEVTDIRLDLQGVSFDRPIRMFFSAMVDSYPFSLKGTVGPIGKEIGQAPVPLDLTVQAVERISLTVKGNISDVMKQPGYDLKIDLASFSPRDVMKSIFPDKPFPVETSDARVLNLMAFKAALKGDARKVDITSGNIMLDDSKLDFDIRIKDISKPDLTFDMKLDQMDVDRYLPAPRKEKGDVKPATSSASAEAAAGKFDYSPLRQMVINGHIEAGSLKVANARINDIKLEMNARNGIIQLKRLNMGLYQGDAAASGNINVQKDVPVSHFEFSAKQIQVGPLLKDVIAKDVLEGVMESEAVINATGDAAEAIKRSLNGKGIFRFSDGAIRGIDLAGMVRNAKAAFGLGEKTETRPRTDFSELQVPFDITSGRVHTSDTRMMSPVIRVTAAGDADLVNETLDFRVEPKFVATLIGQGDTVERSGIMVPVLVGGSFKSPSFRPDLKGMIKQKLEGQIPEISDIKKAVPSKEELAEPLKPLEDTAKDLLKSLPFGK